ncbi:MAG: endonuclease V, partial [Planctomycetaceae bacterium]|nr:endonuclease V [Planctomycetaceae bacterium]
MRPPLHDAAAVMTRPVRDLASSVPNLPHELKRLLRQIPCGRVATYGDLARALGDAKAARWVGEYLSKHPHDDDCPCHRVVRINGECGLYVTRCEGEKAARLRQEGVVLIDGCVPLERFRFDAFHSTAPLAALRQCQLDVAGRWEMMPLSGPPRHVGGVDVSYISPNDAVATFVIVEVASLEAVWSTSVRVETRFPYLSGYLSFRELPIFCTLLDRVREADRVPDVLFVDGNGILHPRRAGSATCVGLAADIPTIGVGKKLLCGRCIPDAAASPAIQRVVDDDEQLGFAIQDQKYRRPFFVSPGHRIDLPSTLRTTLLVLGGGRLPLPIVLADRMSRQDVRRIK